ncbi:hypothetical protein GCK72_010198 [Caenorhabditis remanei]|uniref:Uncharacterized protein n=1 Tax=Caenorhabditis remanei TaxID=31234 RepID=A0A6A5H4J7_CAERE|nr:hypothetical protein GCK72_010198 [Caenorhabditis remanei]KAF1761939.1 hypothetical protein GCK72_010198 [Caenorhabditis remanei]
MDKILPCAPVNQDDVDLLNDPVDGFPLEGDIILRKQRDSAQKSVGLPNAVQVITLPNCEEMCLRVMKIVESVSVGVQRLQWRSEEDRTETMDEKNTPAGVISSHEYFKRIPLHISK